MSSKTKSVVSVPSVKVRYDGNAKSWAILDNEANPVTHFSKGVMDNVTFAKHRTESFSGCRASTDYIGIATGQLTEGKSVRAFAGSENLSFDERGFYKTDGTVVHKAKKLLLLSDRRALAWF